MISKPIILLAAICTISYSQNPSSNEQQSQKPLAVQQQLKSASDLATGGAVIYGLGLTVNIIGTVIFIQDAASQVNSGNSGLPPLTGLYVSLGGSATSFLGSILTNSAGSKARDVREIAYGDAEEFKGWTYFTIGLVLTAGSVGLTFAEVPYAPTFLSLGGFIFNLSSVISSVGYAHKAYLSSLVIKDVGLAPMLSSSTYTPMGLKLCARF